MTPRLYALCDGTPAGLVDAARVAAYEAPIALVLRCPGAPLSSWEAPLRSLVHLASQRPGVLVGLNVGGPERGASPAAACELAARYPIRWLWLPHRAEPLAAFAQARLPTVRACHTPAQVAAAIAEGTSRVSLSPVWPTPSKPAAPALGRAAFAQVAARQPGQVVALGGVNAERAAQAFADGAVAVAAIRGAVDVARWLAHGRPGAGGRDT